MGLPGKLMLLATLTSRCSTHTSCAGQFLSRGFVVLLRKSIPQNRDLKTAAELGVRHFTREDHHEIQAVTRSPVNGSRTQRTSR